MFEINCDLGEGIANEDLVLPFIDAASVACGGHIGDAHSMRNTLKRCIDFGKKAGAHPSYPDPQNFGRKSLIISDKKLLESLQRQIDVFLTIAGQLQVPIDHIKFHGALYNDAAKKTELAEVLCEFISENYPSVPLFVPPHSAIEKVAKEKEIPIKRELFGDRAYTDNYLLLSRSKEHALFTELAEVESHLKAIIEDGIIESNSGKKLPITAETICFHGDNPGILSFLPIIRQKWWH
ncbi:LamB/YcsF family protein [Algoriphagus hitonicola]|uniref:UPF0271 protein n=1 Tax=Algoriphagus hitonicola TaxID=435880 RepID=A0A1I2XAT7_9BACT|nr:LamB/YcsF family protein [Algoriphagus hitonicola]SFH10660.1 UPF0271 protein [Algoriphagus hitonicola]